MAKTGKTKSVKQRVKVGKLTETRTKVSEKEMKKIKGGSVFSDGLVRDINKGGPLPYIEQDNLYK